MISIEADDLPDAVYVEGSLDGGGTGSIVFIEDDVAADALTPESDRDLRRGIEPRMRERRLAVKRAQGRKRLKWLVAALVLVILGRRRAGHVRIVVVRDPRRSGHDHRQRLHRPRPPAGGDRRPRRHPRAGRRHAAGRARARGDPVGRGRQGHRPTSRTA